MKPSTALYFLLLLPLGVQAGDSFDSRQMNAKRLERTEAGRSYWNQLMVAFDNQGLEKIQGECFGAGGEPGTSETYALIADAMAGGSFENVEVRPNNAKTACVASKFRELKAPHVPHQFQKHGFPLIIETTQNY